MRLDAEAVQRRAARAQAADDVAKALPVLRVERAELVEAELRRGVGRRRPPGRLSGGGGALGSTFSASQHLL